MRRAPGTCFSSLPAPMVPAEVPTRGEGRASSRAGSEIGTPGTSAGSDLGGGFMRQSIYGSTACDREANRIVHDGAARAALVIGHDDRALLDAPRSTGRDRIAAAAGAAGAAGAPLPLDRLAAMAADEGHATRRSLEMGGRINGNGRVMRIDGACRTFDPRRGPGN